MSQQKRTQLLAGRAHSPNHPPEMLDKLVVDLTLNDLRKWRDQLTSKARRKKFSDADEVAMPNGLTEKTRAVPPLPLAPSGVNRVCTIMKAALNLAADRDGRITNRRPWEQGLATLPDAEESRNVILSDYQVRLLVDHSQIQGAAFAPPISLSRLRKQFN